MDVGIYEHKHQQEEKPPSLEGKQLGGIQIFFFQRYLVL